MSRMDEIRNELAEIDRLEDPSSQDVTRQRSLILEYDNLQAQRRRAHLESVASDPANREPAVGELGRSLPRRGYAGQPWEYDRFASRSEVVGRAMDLVEAHNRSDILGGDGAEAATVRIQSDLTDPRSDVAKHVLMTGTDDYRRAFEQYLQDPQGMRYRAALSLTLANGGYLLPYILDPTIVLTNAGSSNPLRQVSRIVSTTSNAWQGVYSTGVDASWYPEATVATDATPTVSQIKVVPNKAAAWVFGSFEVLDDTNFSAQLPSLFADAKDRLELGSFTTGTGTNEPAGFVTSLGTGTSTTGTQTVSTVSTSGVYLLHQTLAPRWRQSPSFAVMGNLVNLNALRQVASFTNSYQSILSGDTLQVGATGVRVLENSAMTTATTAAASNILVFGDWSQNLICDRVGVSVIYEPLVASSGSYLPSGQAGWYMFWRSGTALTTTGTTAANGPFRGLKCTG